MALFLVGLLLAVVGLALVLSTSLSLRPLMKPAKDRPSGKLAIPLDQSMARRILTQGQMRSEIVVIAGVGRKDPAQMGFAEDHETAVQTAGARSGARRAIETTTIAPTIRRSSHARKARLRHQRPRCTLHHDCWKRWTRARSGARC